MLFLSQHNIRAKYKKILKVLSRWEILTMTAFFWFSLCEQETIVDIIEYSGLDIHAVQWVGNRLAIIQNTRNLTKVKTANARKAALGLTLA